MSGVLGDLNCKRNLDRFAGFDRLDETQAFKPEVGQHRAGVGIDKPLRSEEKYEIFTLDPSAKDRTRRSGDLIHVYVERATGELGKVRNIFERDRVRVPVCIDLQGSVLWIIFKDPIANALGALVYRELAG